MFTLSLYAAGMLKWAVAKDEQHRNNSMSTPTTSGTISKPRKRLKASPSNVSTPSSVISEVELSGEYKPRSSQLLHQKNGNHRLGTKTKSHFRFSRLMKSYYVREQSNSFSTNQSKLEGKDSNNGMDSKSMLYMSLDQLPLAIVKQYERMLQDTNTVNNNSSNSVNIDKLNTVIQPLKKCRKAKSPPGSSRSSHSSSRGSSSGLILHSALKKESKSHPSNPKKVTICTSRSSLRSSSSSLIREAKNRPLKVYSTSSRTGEKDQKLWKRTTNTNGSKSPGEKLLCNEIYPTSAVCSDIISPNCRTNHYDVPSNDVKKVISCGKGKVPTVKQSTKITSACGEDYHKVRNEFPKNACSPLREQNNNVIESVDELGERETNDTTARKVELGSSNKPKSIDSKGLIPSGDAKNEEDSSTKWKSKLDGYNIYSSHHDTTDPQFLEKSITFVSPRIARCARKLTLKRSELRKLERIKNQTERLNRFLKRYYHDCLPQIPGEQDEEAPSSPEEKSLSLAVLQRHWTDANRFSDDSSSCSVSSSGSSSISRMPTVNSQDLEHFENIKNSSYALYENDDFHLLPIIPEDSPSELSSSSEYKCPMSSVAEIGRRVSAEDSYHGDSIMPMSFLTDVSVSTTDSHDNPLVGKVQQDIIPDDPALLMKHSGRNGHHNDNNNNNEGLFVVHDACRSSYVTGGGPELEKLKGRLSGEPLGEPFEMPTLEDEGFMSPYPPVEGSSPTTSTSLSRFSISSGDSDKSSRHYPEKNSVRFKQGNIYDDDKLNPISSCSSDDDGYSHNSFLAKGSNSSSGSNNELPHLDLHNETWDSHTHLMMRETNNGDEHCSRKKITFTASSSCSSDCCSSSITSSDSGSFSPQAQKAIENHHEKEDMSITGIQGGSISLLGSGMFSCATPSGRKKSVCKKPCTPRKLVRKPPVKSTFSGKGKMEHDCFILVMLLQEIQKINCHSSAELMRIIIHIKVLCGWCLFIDAFFPRLTVFLYPRGIHVPPNSPCNVCNVTHRI